MPLNAIKPVGIETTGVLGYQSNPFAVAAAAPAPVSIWGSSGGGTETTGVNSFGGSSGSSPAPSGCGGSLDAIG